MLEKIKQKLTIPVISSLFSCNFRSPGTVAQLPSGRYPFKRPGFTLFCIYNTLFILTEAFT